TLHVCGRFSRVPLEVHEGSLRDESSMRVRSLRLADVLSLSRHVPSLADSATRSVAQNEARKRRASERHVVGCCEELAGRGFYASPCSLHCPCKHEAKRPSRSTSAPAD